MGMKLKIIVLVLLFIGEVGNAMAIVKCMLKLVTGIKVLLSFNLIFFLPLKMRA